MGKNLNNNCATGLVFLSGLLLLSLNNKRESIFKSQWFIESVDTDSLLIITPNIKESYLISFPSKRSIQVSKCSKECMNEKELKKNNTLLSCQAKSICSRRFTEVDGAELIELNILGNNVIVSPVIFISEKKLGQYIGYFLAESKSKIKQYGENVVFEVAFSQNGNGRRMKIHCKRKP